MLSVSFLFKGFGRRTFLDGFDVGAGAAGSVNGFLILLGGGGGSLLAEDDGFPVLRNWGRHGSLSLFVV